jgi:putative DNA primase/helicase
MSDDDDDAAKLVSQFARPSEAEPGRVVQLRTTVQAQSSLSSFNRFAPGAKAAPEPEKPKDAPKPETAPPPKASSKPEAVEPEGAEAAVEAVLKFKEAPAIISPTTPYDTANQFVQRHCREDATTVVWFWQGEFWRWNGKHYAPQPKEVIKGHVTAFLAKAQRWVGPGQTTQFTPQKRHVEEVLYFLESGLALGVEYQPPMWLGSREGATEWIAFANGVVNVLTGEVREPSPDLWVHSALSFDWDPHAECPAWEKFLDEVFPDDSESKQFIEEWMGYCMTEETRFQKGAMLIGEKRSGKGTITNVLRQLVGAGSYIGLSFDTWVPNENSRQPLIGKRVGVFADVRFKQGRAYGSSYDPGGINHISAGLLLNITGEDPLSIPRKFIGPWDGQLRLKLMLISNEVPNLNDASGVLPSRFIKVRFAKSFFGREDVNLRGKLAAELSGIAARCVAAYQRLCTRGRFIQPFSATALEHAVLAASDPFAAMALECFEADHEGMVIKTVAYSHFEWWCEHNGRLDLKRSIPVNKFGSRLRDVDGFNHIYESRPRQPNGSQGPRVWLGIRLRAR